MKKLRFIYLIGIFLFVISSCDKMDELIVDSPQTGPNLKGLIGCNDSPDIYELIAGKNENVGTVTVDNDQVNLYVTYETEGEWLIGEIHIYVGDSTAVPSNKKNTPVPGHFPYVIDEDLSVSSYTYVIPLTEELVTLECFAVIAHAVVFKEEMIEGEMIETDEETAWGCGGKDFTTAFGTTRWGCFGEYCLVECEEEPEVKYLTFKTFTDLYYPWAVLTEGEKLFTTGWCQDWGLVIPEDGDIYDLMIEGNVFAIATVSIVENNLILNITSTDSNVPLFSTYWFYGTKAEFVSDLNGDCPFYTHWLDPVVEPASTHEIIIPLDH
ncbi:MAG TPA: hypothetical protein ENI20_14920 [Bacteroides sp.]|nr:hypothetical protein [Bacteroides sp.]